MTERYTYEMRKGKKIVGYYVTHFPIYGKNLIVPAKTPGKTRHSEHFEVIQIPISTLLIEDNGVEYAFRRYLDVTRKSKRQITAILAANR